MNYSDYQERIKEDISECLESMGVQPILFFGSGMSQRYMNAPTWESLLTEVASRCPKIDKSLAYFKQKHGSLIKIGSIFSEYVREWAWEQPSAFPETLFEGDQPADIYIKHIVSEILKEVSQGEQAKSIKDSYKLELNALKSINPYSVITTNYDEMLEEIFDGYIPVVGQSILRANYASVGEILKIHGSLSDPQSIVLTEDDYSVFKKKKKYLSAKLLTYFAEHPLVILGYSAQDPNIKDILSDIDEILSQNNDLIPNIYIVEWDCDAEKTGSHPSEKLISIDNDKSIRVKLVRASCFEWVFSALASGEAIDSINPKLLRSVLARTYNLVRHDIPSKTIEVDFQILEHAVSSEENFSKLYGITTLEDPVAINATYPYTITSVAQKLGYSHWNKVHQLFDVVKEKNEFDIRRSDNNYHIAIKSGKSSTTHKYSEACIELLKRVRNGEEYTLRN